MMGKNKSRRGRFRWGKELREKKKTLVGKKRKQSQKASQVREKTPDVC